MDCSVFVFFFKYTATTDIYTDGHTLSLHDALPVFVEAPAPRLAGQVELGECPDVLDVRQRALVHEAGRAHRFWRRFARRGQRHDHVQVSGRQRLRGLRGALDLPRTDRKRVVSGKSVSVRVDFGGCRINKKKNNKNKYTSNKKE